MGTILLIARLLLAGVFGVAGIAKLSDRDGSRQALVGFGLPGALANPLAILLPLAELLAAIALLPTVSSWWGAVATLALLLFFIAGIAVSLVQGRRPVCHCFGQLYSAPVGWPTLARNVALAVVAVVIIWQGWENPSPSAFGWLVDLPSPEQVSMLGAALALALVAVNCWFSVQLLRQNGRLLLRIEALEANKTAGNTVAPVPTSAPTLTNSGLPIGSPAPSFALPGSGVARP
jgi:hypothetical protein